MKETKKTMSKTKIPRSGPRPIRIKAKTEMIETVEDNDSRKYVRTKKSDNEERETKHTYENVSV